MNEDLQKALVSYLEKLDKAIKTGGDFVVEQAPLLIQEYLNWYFWSAILLIILFTILSIIALFLLKNGFYYVKKCSDCPTDFDVGMAIMNLGFGTILIVSSVINLPINITKAIKVTVAPRVVILEQVKALVKDSR